MSVIRDVVVKTEENLTEEEIRLTNLFNRLDFVTES